MPHPTATERDEAARRREDSCPPNGVWFALAVRGDGSARALELPELRGDAAAGEIRWIHLDPRVPAATRWLVEQGGFDEAQRDVLLHGDRLPRVMKLREDTFVVSLGDVPIQSEGGPQGIATVAFAIDRDRIVSLAPQHLPGLEQVAALCRTGHAPRGVPRLFAAMAAWPAQGLHESAIELEIPIAELEYAVDAEREMPNDALRELDTRILHLRRSLAPLQILVERMLALGDSWLLGEAHPAWRDLGDEVGDTAGLLQAAHDRARALHASIAEQLGERTNHILYVLALLSAVMLPLTLVTGVLGMNVAITDASMPGLEAPIALVIVCLALLGIAWVGYRLIRRLKLL